MSLHPGGLYSWRLSITLISYRRVNLENTAYAHGKLRKGLLALVQSTMVSKQSSGGWSVKDEEQATKRYSKSVSSSPVCPYGLDAL